MIPLAITLATHFLPELVDHLAGPKAAGVASTIVKAASIVTGVDPSHPDAQQQMMDALQKDPALIEQMKSKMIDEHIAEMQEDTKRLVATSQTMQVEYGSTDWYVRRWRPTYGYAVAISWFVQMSAFSFALAYTIVMHPDKLSAVITSLAAIFTALAGLWGIALAVLGVSVHSRSKDKQTAAGITAPSIISSLTNVFGQGGGK